MNLAIINQESNVKWFRDNGNYTHAINYPIDENSTVIDLGGFHGLWADVIIEKYNPYVVLVEPIPEFFEFLKNKFKNNSKVTVLNFGVSNKNYNGQLFLNGDGTSKFVNTAQTIDVEFLTIQKLLETIGKEKIELMQINIEGEEFPLLEKMIEDESILCFDNIQIQFHTYVENAIERRNNIKNGLSNHFIEKYDYPFVFEGWSLKK